MYFMLRKIQGGGKKTAALVMSVLLLLSVLTCALTAIATEKAGAAQDEYLYIPVSLYDYKYNNQVETPGAAPDAGTRSGGFPNYLPYSKLNEQIAGCGYDTPLYFGDFYNGYGSEKLTNFKYGANLANQSNNNAAAIGLVDDSLSDGKLTQNGKELPYFSRDWFNANRAEGTGKLNTVTFEFYSGGSWWQDTADKTKRSFIQGNTYTYTAGTNGSRTFVQTAKGDSSHDTTFIINLDSTNSWKVKPERVRLHITSVGGTTVTQEVTVRQNSTQRRASYTLANSSDYTVTGTTYADIYENVEFPFYQTKRGGVTYYEFDSSQKNLYFDGTDFNYTDKAVYDTAMSGGGKPGFFPFNDGNPSDKGKLDYGFGAKFEIPFSMTANGKVDGGDIVFEFSGDDDVWIFIDGKLVLDMGGAHSKSDGTINFRTMESTVTTGVSDGNTNDKYATVTKPYIYNFSDLVDFSDPTQTHTLTMFYMERGMWESNMKLSFNFPQTNTLTIDSDTSFEGVNTALLSQTKIAADNNAFSYSLENKGSTAAGNSGLVYPETYDVVRSVEGQKTILNKAGEPPDTGHTLMLDAAKAGWTQAYAYTWVTGLPGTYTAMVKDDQTGYFYCDLADTPQNVAFRNTDGGTWTNVNSTEDQSPGTNNLFTIGDTDTSKSRWTGTWSSYGGSTADPDDNFVPDGDNWTKVKPSVIHGLYDSFATPKTMTGRGQTVLFGQKIKYVNQFTRGSDMRLLQEEALQTPSRSQDNAVVYNPSGKNLSDYYTTSWVLEDVDGVVLGYGDTNGYITDSLRTNAAGDSFNFSNLDQNDTVRSTAQTVLYTNTVKTADIVFSKKLTAAADAVMDSETEYSFKVELSNIFGGGDDTFRTYPVDYTVDGVTKTAGNDGIIKIKKGQTAVISGVPVGTKYKVTETDIPEGLKVVSVSGDETKSILAGTLSQLGVSGEFLNDLSSAQITISKTIDELYYGKDDNPAGLSSDTVITDTNLPGDTHGYEEYTGAKQSFVFKVEQFDTQDCAGQPNKTSYVVISFGKEDAATYTKSETLSVDPGKYYKITELTALSWKYSLISVTVSDSSGLSKTDGLSAVLYGTIQNPKASFTNRKSTDLNHIEGDTALAQNKLTPAP